MDMSLIVMCCYPELAAGGTEFKLQLYECIATAPQSRIKSNLVNGPGGGNPCRISESVNGIEGARSTGKASHGGEGCTIPSANMVTWAWEMSGIFITCSRKSARHRWNATGRENISGCFPMTLATRFTASLSSSSSGPTMKTVWRDKRPSTSDATMIFTISATAIGRIGFSRSPTEAKAGTENKAGLEGAG